MAEDWATHFVEKESNYDGYVSSVKDADNLINQFELSTTTKFSVWKTTKKKFGEAGNWPNQRLGSTYDLLGQFHWKF